MDTFGTRHHPAGDAVTACRNALATAADTPLHLLPADDREQLLRDLVSAESQLAALKLRTLACSHDIADRHGQRDVATWLALAANQEPARLRAEHTTALSLDARWHHVTAALSSGRVTTDQARVIARGLDDLAARPDLVDPDIVTTAEAELVAYATGEHDLAPDRGFSPRQLRVLAERILHVVAPEIADEEDARRLERLEQKARAKTKLTIKALGDGITRITAIVPDHIGIRLRTYLDAFTNPRREPSTGGDPGATTLGPLGVGTGPAAPEDSEGASGATRPRLPRPRALGNAFCTLLERLDPTTLPTHGGDATTIMITIELDKLLRDVGTAELLDAGDDPDACVRVSPAELRRLACSANILPAVLGSKGEVLDLGRTRRLFSPAQRRALRLRDKTCRAEGCTTPAVWTEAHHDRAWSAGGATDLDNAVSVCSHHHHREHDPAYRTDVLPNGDRRYHRRR